MAKPIYNHSLAYTFLMAKLSISYINAMISIIGLYISVGLGYIYIHSAIDRFPASPRPWLDRGMGENEVTLGLRGPLS